MLIAPLSSEPLSSGGDAGLRANAAATITAGAALSVTAIRLSASATGVGAISSSLSVSELPLLAGASGIAAVSADLLAIDISYSTASWQPNADNTVSERYPDGNKPTVSNLIPLMLDGSHTYQAADLPSATETDGVYSASIGAGLHDETTWYNADEGRLDYVTLTGDFDIRAHNIGLTSGATPGDYQFCGLLVWLSSGNWEFAVAGNRAATTSTIEYKSTLSNSSTQNDIGTNAITNHMCDLRAVRTGSTVSFYYRQVGEGEGDWLLLPHASLSHRVAFGAGAVRVGIITYSFSGVAAFTSSCDSVQVAEGSPV